jgi:hypothetical protein
MAVTWNPSDKHSTITLSNGNLTAEANPGGAYNVRATEFKSSLKYYWEIYIDSKFDGIIIGIGTSSAALNQLLGNDVYGWGYRNSGKILHNNSEASYGNSFTTGDIIGVALDMSTGKIWFAKNNVWQSSGDPAAGTNEAYSGITGSVAPMVTCRYGSGSNVDKLTARFSSAGFSYTPPTGFVSLEYVPLVYYFSGYVFEQNNPVSREIHLHNRATGNLESTTTSSGNGYYYMETASSGSYYIVCLDDEAGVEYNDLIIGPAFPSTVSG